MKKPPAPPTDLENLRKEALDRLSRNDPMGQAQSETTRLLHELEVHRIELEMQNEQLRSAQHDLEVGLDRYTQLFDFAPIGYATLTAHGDVREVNHAGATLLQDTRANILGRRFTHFLGGEHRDAFDQVLAEVARDNLKKVVELELAQRGMIDQRPIARVSVSSLAGRLPIFLVAFEDVSAQKHAEAALRRADDALREADRRKDEFLAVVSHELRTPLSSVLMHAQLLLHTGLDAAMVAQSARVIERAVKEQTRLIDELLDVSRIVAGKLVFQQESVDVASVVRAAVDTVVSEAKKKDIKIELTIDGGGHRLTGDAIRLQQAIQNLLVNAVKFTPMSGSTYVSLRAVDGQARIQVRDTGDGIDPHLLPHLFERFWQADRSSTRSTGGLGLGLSIVRSIVDAHGGTIRAESRGKGLGSTFTIELPLPKERPASTPPQAAARGTTKKRLKGARLLVVEDDARTRATLTKVLEHAGATVRDADSGAQAMKVIGRFKPDLVVCDIAMPGEDGCSLLRRIRARGKKNGGGVAAVALTAIADASLRVRTREAGFQEHLVKPVELETLLATVSTLLPRKGGAGSSARAR
jgi:PAS domain S-box-containing protein